MSLKNFDPLTASLTGRNLIEASAGTGKTFTISRIFLRLIIERNLQVDQILVVTFTEAATNELKERIHATLLQARQGLLNKNTDEPLLAKYLSNIESPSDALFALEHAIQNFDEAAILTIHRFCNRVLQENAFESGGLFDTELVTEQTSLLRQVVEDFWRKKFYAESRLFLRYGIERLNPGALFRLLGNRIGRLGLNIVPEPEQVQCEVAEEAFGEAYAKAARTWQSERENCIDILSRHKGLYKNISEQLPKIFQLTDLYFSSGTPNAGLFSDFQRLTTDGLAAKTKKGFEPPAHIFFHEAQNLFDRFQDLSANYDQKLLAIKTELFSFVQTELQKRKQEQNIYYFDDLLLNLHSVLQEEPGDLAAVVRKKYRAALIDEFQDTDPVQYEIFNVIFNDPASTLFMIGDPKQAIYSFRGADIFAYMQAKEDTRPENRYTLTTNHRSAPGLVSAFNSLFDNATNPFLYEAIPFHKGSTAATGGGPGLHIANEGPEPFQVWYWDPEDHLSDGRKRGRDEAREIVVNATASEISRLLNLARDGRAMVGECALEERDIAVLVRANAEAHAVQRALNVRGINSVLYSSDSLFTSREVAEMARILAAVIEPTRTGRLKAALTTEIIGVGGNDLLAFAEDDSGLGEWYLRFSGYHRLWRDEGFIRMFREFTVGENVQERLMAYVDGERRITNLLHLGEILNRAEIGKRLNMTGLLKWLVEQRLNIDKSVEEHQIRLESDDNAVKLVTMHMSKGLEYAVVFCPFTWYSSAIWGNDVLEYHDPDNENAFSLDLGSAQRDANKILAEKEKLAENLRLLYVAVTRAKHRCYLVAGKFASSSTSALDYLLHKSIPFDETRPVDALKVLTKSIDTKTYRQALAKLADESNGTVFLSNLPEPVQEKGRQKLVSGDLLKVRHFDSVVDTSMRIASYSSLTAKQAHAEELADHDTAAGLIDWHEVEAATAENEFHDFLWFPRGPRTGLFVHNLIEHLDFTAMASEAASEYIARRLDDYAFDERWQSATESMLLKLVHHPLSEGCSAFALDKVTTRQRLNELEFYFPVRSISARTLESVFRKHGYEQLPETFPERMETLFFAPFHGYMKGFIDLVCEQDGRYFIFDWKSNFLGSRSEDYQSENIGRAMVDSFYILQYHIYAIALHQYLKLRLPGYEYDKHFGGVYYIFLRGLSEPDHQRGVFFSRPSEALISDLATQILGA